MSIKPKVTELELIELEEAAKKAYPRPYFIAECGGNGTDGKPLLSLCYGTKDDPRDTYDLIDSYDVNTYTYLGLAANIAERLGNELRLRTAWAQKWESLSSIQNELLLTIEAENNRLRDENNTLRRINNG